MDGLTMREPDDARRLEELPEHEDDSDVDQIGGGGIMQEGGTAVDRGTGEHGGLAQQGDPYDATEPGMTGDDPDWTGPGFVVDAVGDRDDERS